MTESSEESFLWTSASNDSNSSQSDSSHSDKLSNMKKDNIGTKEKKQKKVSQKDGKKKEKDCPFIVKKRKHSEVFSNSDGETCHKDKTIKSEINSDDKFIKEEMVVKNNKCVDNKEEMKSFLELKVKLEDVLRENNDSSNISLSNNISTKEQLKCKTKRKNDQRKNDDDAFSNGELYEHDVSSFKNDDDQSLHSNKKKKKKSETPNIDKTSLKKNKRKHQLSVNSNNSDNKSTHLDTDFDVKDDDSTEENNHHLKSDLDSFMNLKNASNRVSETSRENTENSYCMNESLPNINGIAETTLIEEDLDLDITNDSGVNNVTLLSRFIKQHPEMQSIPSNRQSLISTNDDIWIIHAPYFFSLESMNGQSFLLDKKCKIKTDSSVYEATLKEGSCHLLAFENKNSWLCANLRSKGVLELRKRLPKVHLSYEDVLKEQQSEPLPLPESRRRHPLFGPRYKKMVRLPPSVQKRLDRIARKRHSTKS